MVLEPRISTWPGARRHVVHALVAPQQELYTHNVVLTSIRGRCIDVETTLCAYRDCFNVTPPPSQIANRYQIVEDKFITLKGISFNCICVNHVQSCGYIEIGKIKKTIKKNKTSLWTQTRNFLISYMKATSSVIDVTTFSVVID